MKVVKSILFFTLVLLAITVQLDSSTRMLQTTQRSEGYTKMCVNYPDRNSLVDEKAQADAESSKQVMQSSFKLSGTQLISGILNSEGGAMAGALVVLPTMGAELGTFAGPFALGLIIILLIWPFLCCCCCCPGCCPSKCCQKPDNQQYTKCELIWPVVVLILASLLIAIASMIGVTRSSDIQKSLQAVFCSVGITFDDVINGNISSTGNYFIGMGGLVNTLAALRSQVPNIDTQMQKLKYTNASSPLRIAYDQGTFQLDLISKIPDTTAGGSMGAFTYNHFDGTAGTISSGFPTFLGSATPSSQAGAIGTGYSVVDQINEGLKTIADSAQSFSSQIGTITTTIDQLSTSMSDMTNLVRGYDSQISGINDSISPILKIVTIAVTAFFGVFIALSVLNIVAALLMTFCDKFSCRYLIYFTCLIFFLLGIFCFLLSFLFSIITPILYFGCDFITTSISSPAGFNTNVGSLLGAQLSSYVSVCLPGGTGRIIEQLGVDVTAITGLSTVVNQMRAFNVTTLQNGVLTALNTLSGQIDKYYFTDVYDFVSTSDRNYLARAANPSNYAGCTDNSFSGDNWVPSLRNSDIGCVNTRQVGLTQCPTATQVTAGQASTNCYGCIDSAKVLLNLATPATAISTRYNTAITDCNTWNTDITNIINRYYSVKKTNYGPIRTRMAGVITRFNDGTNGYNVKISNINSAFTSIITILEGLVSTVVDPNYGMVAGLNCLLLGEDINLLANTACNKLFVTLSMLRLTLGLAAFGILFSMCCTTCSGVRAFKHSQRIGLIQPKQSSFGNQQTTMGALNQKY